MCVFFTISIPTVPGPIHSLTATPKVISIVLSWRPPLEPNGVIIAYEVRYSSEGITAEKTNVTVIGQDNSFTITGLLPSTRYNISVVAYTIVGPGVAVAMEWSTTNIRKLTLCNLLLGGGI